MPLRSVSPTTRPREKFGPPCETQPKVVRPVAILFPFPEKLRFETLSEYSRWHKKQRYRRAFHWEGPKPSCFLPGTVCQDSAVGLVLAFAERYQVRKLWRRHPTGSGRHDQDRSPCHRLRHAWRLPLRCVDMIRDQAALPNARGVA